MSSIKSVYADGLCMGCGICAGMCLSNAITMVVDQKQGVYRPVIDSNKCTGCGYCYKICPGHSVDFEELNKFSTGQEPQSSILGSYLGCFNGCSMDNKLCYVSSSGGLVTQLLICALEKGIIDGALVTSADKDNPLRPRSFIARTKKEMISAAGAKYCPVPVNVMLKEIRNAQPGLKFAVVGLPCQIQGIRKAELINEELKKKIVLHLGIFCTHGINFRGTRAALKRMGIKEKQVESLRYRFGDFPPGKTLIKFNGVEKVVDHLEFWNLLLTRRVNAIPDRCRLCIDQTAELADISVGSGWFAYKANKQINRSVGLIRNTVGKTFMQQISSANRIDVLPANPEALELFEEKHRGDKKRRYRYLLLFLKLSGRKYPDYHSRFLKSKIKFDFKMSIEALKNYLRLFLFRKKHA